MPSTDIVEIDVTLAPKAGSRSSLGIATLLHILTDAQDAEFGTDFIRRVDEATWEAELADIGITNGELAYEDVRAHFSQENKPDHAFIGRRGEGTAIQVKTLTIIDPGGDALDGLYRLEDIEGGPYEHTAASETPTVVRDALLALVTAGTHLSFADATSGAASITFTAANPGVDIPMTLVSPVGGATLALTTQAKELKRKQERTVLFPTGSDGPYKVTVNTSTGQKVYQWTEASGTGTGADQATVFKALFDADPSDLVSDPLAAPVGGLVTMVAATAGVNFTPIVTTPSADAIVEVTVTNYNIADDILRAQEAGGWYVLINGSRDATDIEQAAEFVEAQRMLHVVQSSDADIRTTVDTDIFSKLKAAQRGRSAGVEHPVDAEGVHSAWAGDVTTDGPGKVSWNAIPLTGFSGQNFTLLSEAARIRGKEGSYLERFDARSQDIMIGGYSFDGRPFDLRRALDTFCLDVEAALFDLLVVKRIVPYTAAGIAETEARIRVEWDRALSAGYGVSLDLRTPDITDATSEEANRGIQPLFIGHAVMQVGTYVLRASFTVSQEAL